MNHMKSRLDRPLVALIGAFVLAIAHQYLFYGNLPGVSYPIFIGLLYSYMYYNAKEQMVHSSWFGWLLFGSILLLSLTYVLFQNPFFYVLNVVVIPSLFFVHMAYIFSKKRPVWYKPQVIGVAFEHLIVQSLSHVPTAFRIVKKKSSSTVEERRKSVMAKVLIGLAISTPLLMVVISLLASADGVFEQFLSDIPDFLGKFSFGDGFFRFVWVCIVCLLLFGYLWGFIDSKKYEWGHVKGEDRVDKDVAGDPLKVVFDPIITVTVLIAVNIVYVLFVILQFSYLFGAGEGTLPTGASYADYARSGFFELMIVTAINFVLLMGTLVFSVKEEGLLQRINNIMLYILVVCSCVMLYSAYMRLVLYEEAYGYTYIRFLVHAFMIFLGILIIVAGLRIHFASLPIAKCYIVLGLLSYVIMNYTSMDRMIAEKNMERYKETGVLDQSYLHSLSTDATSSLIRFSLEEDRIMDKHLKEQWQDLSLKEYDWPSFNVSEYRAERALEKYFRGEK